MKRLLTHLAGRTLSSGRSLGLLVGAAVAVTACDPAAETAPVAWVGEWSLTQQRLADLLVLAQPLPLDSGTVGVLVDQWISAAAVAQQVGSGVDLEGPEAVEASLWLERREAIMEAARRARLGESTRVTPGQARARFDGDTLLLLAHVLRRTAAITSDAERDLQRRTAQGILDGLLAGGGWSEAVAQSDDADTRGSSGLLGLLRVDELPARLGGAAASLEPGQVSSVVESAQGYHILHRPRFEDVADLYARLLSDRLLAEADSATDRQISDSIQAGVVEGGTEWLRAFVGGEHVALVGPLVTWEGGTLDVEVVALYVDALPGDARARLGRAPERTAEDFLEQLAVREARLEEAVRAGFVVDPVTEENLIELHRADVEGWRNALSDGAPPFSQQAVDRYMERLVARQTPLDPMPALLRRWLLESLSWGFDAEAQTSAAASARGLISAADNAGSGS